MPYSHVFATHALLQEHLVDAIIRDAQILPENVLVIRMRQSFRAGEARPYRVIDGDQFNTTNGRNLPGHRLANRRRCRAFEQQVLAALTPGFMVYSPMYTFWYLNVLAAKASAYHVLEDGFASYLPREEILKYINLTRPFTGRRKWQRQLVTEPLQRTLAPAGQALLEEAGRFYVTSRLGFPWLPDRRRVVVSGTFPPYAPGEYAAAVVWGPGCLVEAGYVTVPVYQSLIRGVMDKLLAAGVTRLYFKWHPTQVAHPANLQAYRAVLTEYQDRLQLVELAQSVSIESLAAGNEITLITGFSTLSFHVAAAGGEVRTYLADILRVAPAVGQRLGAAGRAIFDRISKPL